jgi:DNA polymerase-3 subunit delta'
MTTSAETAAGGVWAELVGQSEPVDVLRRAVSGGGHAMTHAWLITGPPGSGRSNAARAFAAALQCDHGGCSACNDCRTALSGAHPDVTLVRTEQLSIGVSEVRELVRRAAMRPTLGRRQVLVIEDADRVTERGADALLKGIEEPAAKTVWILCAPTADDVVTTIRSRCRILQLHTPTVQAVTGLLRDRDGMPEGLAEHAARAAQGHIGRARVLARSSQARQHRDQILQIPSRLGSLGDCLQAAAELIQGCTDEAEAQTAELDSKERTELEQALGVGGRAAKPRHAQAAIKDLTEQQRARAKRLQRDAIDRALTELTGFYRDVLCAQTESGAALINAESAELIRQQARQSTPEQTMHRIDALLNCRNCLEANVAPLLAVEAMLTALR